jgi:hypothetical protein
MTLGTWSSGTEPLSTAMTAGTWSSGTGPLSAAMTAGTWPADTGERIGMYGNTPACSRFYSFAVTLFLLH